MISSEELKKLSKLARIEISEEEFSGLNKDINSILDYVGQVSQINPEGKQISYGAGPHTKIFGVGAGADKNLRNVMREDKNPQEAGEFSGDLLKEAPNTKDGYVKVKKIL
ncbi:Asp-tRNA(Asn)/Glu-tRNA(Gln) amidotransferase subunit GatC [Patescibacteria group bacterium]|nr:Asp-tRNA(Asn)/Glu-tRNA(Gln) amidotransferase subunit GatC [Patescibacteria group bacterium]MBU4057421.1 Asp-tRNA(Asn)/Glu-tRNA(Gln) amidotransferase subunit GatC [Patescibacteria group bacterium]MBU4115698.1 Asp-tRNA(Asn)/Glu-tRNA(Gln) amidotransferase subunit GatC [Patescibacteria group bacterium]